VRGQTPAAAAAVAAAAAAAAAAVPAAAAAAGQAGGGIEGENVPRLLPDFQMPPPAVAGGAAVHVAGPALTQNLLGGAMAGSGAPSFIQQGMPMMGMPTISEDMLKVHIEWQIESLQNLLRQIESRQAGEEKLPKQEGNDKKPSSESPPE